MKENRLAAIWALLLVVAAAAGCSGDQADDEAQARDNGATADDDHAPSVDDDDNDDDNDNDDQAPPDDPTKRGPFEVGNRTFVFVDRSRQCPFAGGKRTLVTEIWYPAPPEAAGMPRNKLMDTWAGYKEEAVQALLDYGVLPSEIPNFYRDTTSARDAPIDAEHGPYPLVLYSHGWTNYRTQNFMKSEYLASHGFIVVAADHTGDSFFAPIPGHPVYWDGAEDPLFFLEDLRMRIGDERFLIDTMSRLNADDPEGLFTDAIDPEHVGALGFSLGGQTVLETAKVDNRLDAVMSMTSGATPGGFADLHASLMFMVGREDRTLGSEIPLIWIQYGHAPPPKFMGVFPLAGHHSFGDTCLLRPSMGQGDGCGVGHYFWGGEFEFPSFATMSEILQPYLTAFMGYKLRGEPQMGEYLRNNHAPDDMNWFFEMGGGRTE